MFGFLIQQIKKRKLMPTMSDTERAALEAGTVWVDGEIFSGKPDFRRILAESYPKLSTEEQAFVDGPVAEVCDMVNDWDITQNKELPPEVWAFLRKHHFLGLLIPEEYGGHGFGALACSTIFGRLGMANWYLNFVVLIPNSVGPAELITEYGTKEQKEYWLPRLAKGDEIPCFALTEPNAGSDAAAMVSTGVVFKGEDGEPHIHLNWDKRYITLAPIATLIGLAFKLQDPDKLLGHGTSPGITCALVAADLDGVELGRYHDPMGVAFPNGPTKGIDVVIPATNIIGGTQYAGKGWGMLMEALSGGRAISLPAGAANGAKAIARGVGAYSVIRKQFGMPIGRFEGIEEPLAVIGGSAYLMEAARIFTCGALDSGHKPSVISAVAKYNQTELARKTVNHGMDVLGGKAIMRGPSNPIFNGYIGAPIGITVEGANILTRTLIVFGQGVIRAHPYMYREINALANEDPAELRRALFGHLWFFIKNRFRSRWHSLTRGLFASSPVGGPTAKYYKKLTWASARFAYLVDVAVLTVGPKLKQKGKLAGRYADAVSWIYLALATLRRFEAEGRPKGDLPLVHWAVQYALSEVQRAFEGICANFDAPLIGGWMRTVGRFFVRLNPIGSLPSDRLGAKVARILQTPGEVRDRLTGGLYWPAGHVLDVAFELVHQAEPITRKISKAVKKGKLEKRPVPELLKAAKAAGVIDDAELKLLQRAEAARTKARAVDDFSWEEYVGVGRIPSAPKAQSA